MGDDLSKLLQEIMDLTGDKQGALGKRIGVSQSTINRWLHEKCEPSATQFEKVKAAWRKAKGYKTLSLDQKIAPYDAGTQATVHQMVDNYLNNLPPPIIRR
jgi:transcriptional regulator with XRE-family HTH domain